MSIIEIFIILVYFTRFSRSNHPSEALDPKTYKIQDIKNKYIQKVLNTIKYRKRTANLVSISFNEVCQNSVQTLNSIMADVKSYLAECKRKKISKSDSHTNQFYFC